MPGRTIVLQVDAATFAGLDANDYHDGQQVRVSETGTTWEAVGADGARSWVRASLGEDSGRWEVLLDGDSQPVDDGQGDWLHVWVEGD